MALLAQLTEANANTTRLLLGFSREVGVECVVHEGTDG